MDTKQQGAERVAQKYLKAWQRKSYAAMLTLAQPTWREAVKTPKTNLKVMHELYSLKAFNIQNAIPLSDIAIDIVTELTYILSGKLISKTHTLRIVCELGPFQPSENGKWFVNPLSTFTNRGAT
jgi:hypothetical protein